MYRCGCAHVFVYQQLVKLILHEEEHLAKRRIGNAVQSVAQRKSLVISGKRRRLTICVGQSFPVDHICLVTFVILTTVRNTRLKKIRMLSMMSTSELLARSLLLTVTRTTFIQHHSLMTMHLSLFLAGYVC